MGGFCKHGSLTSLCPACAEVARAQRVLDIDQGRVIQYRAGPPKEALDAERVRSLLAEGRELRRELDAKISKMRTPVNEEAERERAAKLAAVEREEKLLAALQSVERLLVEQPLHPDTDTIITTIVSHAIADNRVALVRRGGR